MSNSIHLGGSLYDSFRDFSLATYTNGVILPYPLDEIVLVHGLGVVIDPPAVGFECLNGIETDVF